MLPRPIALKGVAELNAGVQEGFHFLAGDLPRGFRPETDQFVANGFQQQPHFRALDHQGVNVEQLDVGQQTSRVFLTQFRVGVFVCVGMASNEASMEEPTTGGGVGHGQRNAAERSLVGQHGGVFSVVVNLAVLGRLGKVELFHVLTEPGGQVAHQKVGLLDGLLGVDQTVFHLRANHGVGETRWGWMGAARRASVGLRIVPGQQVVENVAGVGEQVGRKGRPVLRKEGRNGLERLEGLFPCGQPNVDLLFAVVKASVQSCIPTTNPVLQCPHQSDGTAFSL